MSSTNVHSEQNNIQIVGGQTIPTEKGIEMPPKSAEKGPSTLDVRQGDIMEIPVGDSILREDGKLVTREGMQVAQFDDKAYKRIVSKHAGRDEKPSRSLNTRRTTKTVADKGEDR